MSSGRGGRLAFVMAFLIGPMVAVGEDVVIDGKTFRVPEGFVVARAAGPPLVDRPITADFDERGRLYVAESSGTNDPVEKQFAERPHRILRLEDSDGDGVFDRRTVYADQMMFPEGTLWHDGSLYVCAPPQIWKLTDGDDDGVAERREIWFDGKTLTSCANDLHGPYLGRDGYIYWCKGAFAEQTYERPGKPNFKTRASHIFRRKADGTGPIEPVMTGGMDNPVDVAFLPNGERFFTTTFLVNPGGGQRDGLIHAIPGAIYGKIHDPIYDSAHKWSSPEVMPPMVHLGPAAPSGLTTYDSEVFGSEYRDNLFASLFNLHKVTRHVLHQAGATYEATTQDFLTSPDVDFHPTDVIEDADGSLLVINTGGWYKLCCPTSQLHKPDVLGAIYRVRKVGAPALTDPRGLAIDWPAVSATELVALLADSRPAVARHAVETLGRRPANEACSALASGWVDANAETRSRIVWAACRIAGTPGHSIIEKSLDDSDPDVRQAGLNAARVLRLPIGEALVSMLGSASDLNRRVAAEALGAVGESSKVSAILDALARDNDRPLDHALTYALIEMGDPAATVLGLAHSHPRVRRAAMVALDQMGEAERLEPREVAGWLNEGDAPLRESAAWVIGRHPEWGGVLAELYRDRLAQAVRDEAEETALADQLARLAESEAIASLLVEAARKPSSSAVALNAMARSNVRRLPVEWAAAVGEILAAEPRDDEMIVAALTVLRGRELADESGPSIALRLAALGRDAKLRESVRLSALGAIPNGIGTIDDALFGFLTTQLHSESDVAARLAAADVLVRARLSNDQLITLAPVLKEAGPLELARLLPAFGSARSAEVGRALIDALAASDVGSSLRVEQLEPVLKEYPESIRDEAQAWAAGNQVGSAEQAARVETLLKELPKGDAGRGHQVFAGTKAACVTCHALGYVGGKVGPDLTKIGEIRTERDLLEAIVYPSASFVRSYEPLTVATRDGRILSGIVQRDTPQELLLTINADQVERLSREQIEELRPGTVSVMPAGLDQQLTPQELADLIAFLKTAR